MEYPAPDPIPSQTTFNSSYFFDITDSAFNFETASKYFLKITGGNISGNININGTLSINGSPIDLSLISGVTAGTPAPNKALSLDASGKITGPLNCSDINTNTIVRVNKTANGQTFNSTSGTSSCVLYHFNNQDAWFGTSTANNLILQTNNTARLIINSLGAISGISSLSTTSLIVNGVSINSSDIAYLSGITTGTVTASKAIVVDANKDISSFRNIFATKFCNNISYTNFAIDMGNTAGDRLMAVFDNGSAFYGFGANGSRLQLHSAAGAGIRMYTGSSVSATGTQILDINSAGLLTCDSITLDTALTVPLANIRDNAQASGTRTEFLSLGRSSSGSDHGAWSFMNYYQSATQGDSNYITFGPRLRTGLTTGWGMVMTQNGNFSFQNKDSNSGSGGFKIQANIVGTVDIMGGNVRSIGAGSGYLQPDSGSPADYSGSSVSTRISLFVENAIWTGDKVYSSSDNRLKRDIKTIPLEESKKLLNINAFSYRWQKDVDDRFLPDIGFIAQDLLENKLDKIVSFCPSSDKERFPKGYYYGLEYQKVCVYQNELIKDLYVQIEELKNEILLLKDTTKKILSQKRLP